VSFAGAVFDAGCFVCDPFEATLVAQAPMARVEPPLLSPLGGAFRLGIAALGVKQDDEAIERLQSAVARNGI
jgi:hypothetical protein